jgi:hypothetical protein
MSGRQTNTLDEFLQKMMRLISDAKQVADNNGLAFLIQLETMILQYIRAPLQQAGVAMPPMGGGQAGMPGGQPAPPGMPPPGMPPGMMTPPGLTPGPQGVGPAADEFRRILTSRPGQAPRIAVQRLMQQQQAG